MIFLPVTLCSGPEDEHRDLLIQEQDSRPPSPGKSVSPEDTLGLLAWPQERPGNGTVSGMPQSPPLHPTLEVPALHPPFQVQIGEAATQRAMCTGSQPSALPTQNTTAIRASYSVPRITTSQPLGRGNRFSFIEFQSPGCSRNHPGLLSPGKAGSPQQGPVPSGSGLSSGSKPRAELGSL